MILCPEDVIALTNKTRHRAQAHALDVIGIHYKTRADGSLIVSRSHVEQSLSMLQQTSRSNMIEPNWNAILA